MIKNKIINMWNYWMKSSNDAVALPIHLLIINQKYKKSRYLGHKIISKSFKYVLYWLYKIMFWNVNKSTSIRLWRLFVYAYCSIRSVEFKPAGRGTIRSILSHYDIQKVLLIYYWPRSFSINSQQSVKFLWVG